MAAGSSPAGPTNRKPRSKDRGFFCSITSNLSLGHSLRREILVLARNDLVTDLCRQTSPPTPPQGGEQDGSQAHLLLSKIVCNKIYYIYNVIKRYNRNLKTNAQSLRREKTPAEKILWKMIRKNQLGFQFYRQVPILDYIVDFYCKERFLIIEVDGKIHNSQFYKDSIRQQRIEKEGYLVIRFTNDEVLETPIKTINKIKEYLHP